MSAANEEYHRRTCSVLPPVGDRGQRYEHVCEDADGNTVRLGWSNEPAGAFARMVAVHPSYRNHRSIDRQNNRISQTDKV